MRNEEHSGKLWMKGRWGTQGVMQLLVLVYVLLPPTAAFFDATVGVRSLVPAQVLVSVPLSALG